MIRFPVSAAHFGVLALLAGLAGCSSKSDGDDGGSNNPNGPSGGGNAVFYSAISASDGTGFGSSNVCLPFADCPDGTGYVQRVVRELRSGGRTVTILNLSIPGSVVGPEIEDLARQLGRGSIGNFRERQMPFVSRESTLVTVFASNRTSSLQARLAPWTTLPSMHCFRPCGLTIRPQSWAT